MKNEHFAICITRTCGSGGTEIGKMLSKQLGIDLPLTSMDKDGYYCIPYMNYIALLTGAIQAQQKQIDRLTRKKKEVINDG